MRAPFLGMLLIGASQVASCQAASPDPERAPEPATQEEVPASASDSIRLWLELPERVRAGEPVPVTLLVENVAERPVDLYLTGRPIAFDLIVTKDAGEVVWRRLEGEVIPAILQIRTLAPGERLDFTDTWDQRSNAGREVAPGRFQVRGELLAEDERLTTPEAPLRITRNAEDRPSIQEVQDTHADRWMTLPGVVGTGIGLCEGEPCIKVFAAGMTEEIQREIPNEVEGYPVRVEVTGQFRPRDPTDG